jgi:hypothetical protein
MISRAKEMADPERKQQLVEAIANFMKMAYVTWNKDNVSDETIIKDLKEFSGGELALNESVNLAKVEYRQAAPARSRNQHNNKGRSNNKNNSNNRQRSNNGAKRY